MIRTEVKALLFRWREAIVLSLIAITFVTLAMNSFGVTRWVALVVSVIALVGLGLALQMGRFRQSQSAPGVVQLVEGKLIYMGPLTGGAIDLDALAEVTFDPKGLPAGHWILVDEDRTTLAIPVGADGQDTLFDAFSALPGAEMSRFARAAGSRPKLPLQVWMRKWPEVKQLH